MDKKFFNTNEAAAYLGIGASTLERLRLSGDGPLYHKLGPRTVRYMLADLEEWAKPHRSTSEVAQ